MRRQRLGFVAAVAMGLAVVLALNSGGCAKTAQGKLDQAEILYANTAGELNDLRETGKISADTYHADVAPSLRSAYAGIKRARAEVKAGNTSELDVLLKGVNDALLKLQPYRPAMTPATAPTSVAPAPRGPTIGPALPPPAQGLVVDPATAWLLIGGATRLIDAASKYLKGDTLTADEEATLQRASDAEAARVDRLDPPPAAPA